MEDSIKTRVYFTSESHLHTVVSALRFINVQGIAGEGGKGKKSKGIFDSDEQKAIDNMPEFDYLTQIVVKVFEDKTARLHSPERFFVQIGLSPGVAGDAMVLGKKHLDCQPMIWCVYLVLCKRRAGQKCFRCTCLRQSPQHMFRTVSAPNVTPSEREQKFKHHQNAIFFAGILEKPHLNLAHFSKIPANCILWFSTYLSTFSMFSEAETALTNGPYGHSPPCAE